MPEYTGAKSGRAAIIEEVETADSITDSEATQWKDYGSLGVKFLLMVPKSYWTEALHLIQRYNVNVSELWYYHFDYDGGPLMSQLALEYLRQRYFEIPFYAVIASGREFYKRKRSNLKNPSWRLLRRPYRKQGPPRNDGSLDSNDGGIKFKKPA